MGNSIRNVAIIGAGVSGVAAAAHLKASGLEVTVFERSKTSGGVWYAYSILLLQKNVLLTRV